MNGQRVDGFNVGVRSELRENAGVDSGRDTVVSSLHAVKHSGALAKIPQSGEHSLLCASDSRHLCARCGLSRGALWWIRCAVTLIAQSLRIDSGGGLIEQLDHHVEVAAIRKFILRDKFADGTIIS